MYNTIRKLTEPIFDLKNSWLNSVKTHFHVFSKGDRQAFAASQPLGQINRDSIFGEIIYDLARCPEFKIYLEIGIWNGRGSTKCFVDGILKRNDNSCLYSIESYEKMHQEAKGFWQDAKIDNLSERLILLYGRIIDASEVMSSEEIVESSHFKGVVKEHYKLYYQSDLSSYETSPNVLSDLPEKIDVLLLDGGEFSTYAEFKKLAPISKVILLDDTNTLKCAKIRDEILESQNWSVIIDELKVRHGFLVACRPKYEETVRNSLDNFIGK